MRAIELNGVAVETSKRTFAWGRLAAHDLAAVQAAAKPTLRVEKPVARTLPDIVAKRVELLTAYQDAGLRRALSRLRRQGRGGREGQGAAAARGLAEAVAKSLYKLMAYKDEYEVGRLYSDGEFLKKLGSAVRGRLQAHLPSRAAACSPIAIRRRASSRSASTAAG